MCYKYDCNILLLLWCVHNNYDHTVTYRSYGDPELCIMYVESVYYVHTVIRTVCISVGNRRVFQHR